MKKCMKKQLCFALLVSMLALCLWTNRQVQAAPVPFTDVPANHWAYQDVHQFRELNILQGYGDNRFGLGNPITRSEFIKLLVRIMNWEEISPAKGSFPDNQNTRSWYYPFIETAKLHNVFPANMTLVRPEVNITREEIAVMMVNSLGYNNLAQMMDTKYTPFQDVTNHKGAIELVKDFGVVKGNGSGKFEPAVGAKREEAVAMLMRLYRKLNFGIDKLHAFYAIKSYPQIDKMQSLDAVNFGWCRMELDAANGQVVLNTTNARSNEYAVPQGFREPLQIAEKYSQTTYLSIFASNATRVTEPVSGKIMGLVDYMLQNADMRQKVIQGIVQNTTALVKDNDSLSFGGALIDFEELRGKVSRDNFSLFLKELDAALEQQGKKLAVAVHPYTTPTSAYFDGYDYKIIGNLADQVILMAHDYYAKSLTDAEMQQGITFTPLTPYDQIYHSLKVITDPATGVADVNKVFLQFSFDTCQWQTKDGRVLNRNPDHPGYGKIGEILQSADSLPDLQRNYSEKYRNPYVTYTDPSTGIKNIIWYEDTRSIADKVKLANLFGVRNVSLWRLGLIPDVPSTDVPAGNEGSLDIWNSLLMFHGK